VPYLGTASVSDASHLASRSVIVEAGKIARRSKSSAARRSYKVAISLSQTGDASGNQIMSCDIAADRRE